MLATLNWDDLEGINVTSKWHMGSFCLSGVGCESGGRGFHLYCRGGVGGKGMVWERCCL